MELKLINTANERPVVLTTQDEEIVVWDISTFDRSNFIINFDLFEYNNAYLNNLDKKTLSRLFNIYKEIYKIIDTGVDKTSISQSISKLLDEFFFLLNIEKLCNFVRIYTDIKINDNEFSNVYIESNEKTGSRQQTYIKSDYWDLLALSIMLKYLMPIWGVFIDRTKKETSTEFKDYYAFLLVESTELMNSEPMQKLKTYIEYSIPDDKPKSHILGGLSSENFSLWIMSSVILRKIIISDISGKEKTSLIPYIYNHVREKVKRCDSNFVGRVEEKTLENSNSNDPDARASKLESFKMRQSIPKGEIVLIQYAMKDLHKNAFKLKSDINLDLLSESLETSKCLEYERLHDSQITLLKWIIAPIIYPEAVMFLEKVDIVRYLALAQTYLWELGHYELAGLITSKPREKIYEFNRSYSEVSITVSDSRSRLTKEIITELETLFPYARRQNIRYKNPKIQNQAIVAIDELADLFNKQEWTATIAENKLKPLTKTNNWRYFSIPTDIKVLLAKFIIHNVKFRHNIV